MRVLVIPVVSPKEFEGGHVGLPGIALPSLLKLLGTEQVTNLLVEGGGEVNAAFLLGGLAHRIAFFYAPKVLGGQASRRAVAGLGARSLAETLTLTDLRWRKLGVDWLLAARVVAGRPGR